MEIIIACLLVIIAAAMFLGKPLKIEVHHKYDPADVMPSPGPDQAQLDKDKEDQQVITDLIANFNKTFLGVESDESNK